MTLFQTANLKPLVSIGPMSPPLLLSNEGKHKHGGPLLQHKNRDGERDRDRLHFVFFIFGLVCYQGALPLCFSAFGAAGFRYPASFPATSVRWPSDPVGRVMADILLFPVGSGNSSRICVAKRETLVDLKP